MYTSNKSQATQMVLAPDQGPSDTGHKFTYPAIVSPKSSAEALTSSSLQAPRSGTDSERGPES